MDGGGELQEIIVLIFGGGAIVERIVCRVTLTCSMLQLQVIPSVSASSSAAASHTGGTILKGKQAFAYFLNHAFTC